jgi:hypothetical protein
VSGGFAALQSALAAHVRDPAGHAAPAGADDARLAVYRDLVFNNVARLLGNAFPVLRSLHDGDAWNALVRAWLREHRAHTPLFPQIAGEFAAWLRQIAASGDAPLWQAELADYEWMETVVASDEREIADVPHDPDGDLLEGRPVTSPLARCLRYRHAVQHIRPGAVPDATPPTPTHIVVARDRNDRVSFTAVNALTAMLLDRLVQPDAGTGRAILCDMAAAAGASAETMIAAGGALLAQLRSRDIVLGTRPE